jgi:hypothetical protein
MASLWAWLQWHTGASRGYPLPYGEAALRFGCHRWEQKAPKTAPLFACAGLSAEVRRRSRTNVHSEATMEHCCAELADALKQVSGTLQCTLISLAVYLNKFGSVP